jgi:acetyl esterase/lipase
MAHLCRDEKLSPPITGCLLMIPFYCYHKAIPESYKADYKSWEQNSHAPILTEKATMLFMDNYCPDEEKRGDPMLSVSLWPTGHAGLPPSYFQICGQDPLRDEALIVEREMREKEGIKTKVDVYPGLPHGFWSIMPTLKASQKFVADSVEGVRWLLEQK